jgi:hypothetical protein
MSPLVCPKCSSIQEGGEECLHCGIIFRKFRQLPPTPLPAAAPSIASGSVLQRSWKVLRWAPLSISLAVLVLILLKPSPPRVKTSPEATDRALTKVEDFERSVRAGTPTVLTMDEAELNGWAKSNLSSSRQPSPEQIATAYVSGQTMPRVEQAPSNVREVRLKLDGDSLVAWVSYDAYGLDVALELAGTLSVRDGYLRLTPISGRLGSLPLTQSVLAAAASRLFDSPENHDKWRLPRHITDIRVSGGQLAITSQ